MSTFDKVRDIFYSGNFSFTGDLEYINEISFLVDNGYLVLKTLDISSKEEFKHLLGKPSEVKELIYRAAGGTLPHIVLKILGGRRLEAMNKIPLFEHEFCGYFPDVMSEDKEIVIECGHTQNADKLLTYFRQGKVKTLIQIPYPSVDDEKVLGYSFTANGEIYEFLEFLDKEKHEKLKSMLKKN